MIFSSNNREGARYIFRRNAHVIGGGEIARWTESYSTKRTQLGRRGSRDGANAIRQNEPNSCPNYDGASGNTKPRRHVPGCTQMFPDAPWRTASRTLNSQNKA